MKITKELLREMVLKEMATFAGAKRKIDAGKTFAIFSAYRGERSYKQNKAVAKDVQDYLKQHGYSYTTVEGGYKETPRDPVTGKETGEPATSEIEKSYLIFEEDTRPDSPKSGQDLFTTVNKACEMSDQEVFVYGYGEVEEKTGEVVAKVGVYETGAVAPGLENAVKEPWSGPWSQFEKMGGPTGYYTKIRSTKGQMAEQIKSLQEMVKKSNSDLEKRRLRHVIQELFAIQRGR
jgi:hypothetical protein